MAEDHQDRAWSADLFERNLPHIRDMIFLRLDSETIENCRKVCQSWERYLNLECFKRSWRSIHTWYVRRPWTAQNYESCECVFRYAAIFTCCDCSSNKSLSSDLASSRTQTEVPFKRARYVLVQSSAQYCCKFCGHCKMGSCGHQGSHMGAILKHKLKVCEGERLQELRQLGSMKGLLMSK